MIREFNITGMTCASCQSNIQKTVSKIKGVQKTEVNLINNSMTVECNANVSAATIIAKVASIGYGASEKGVTTTNSDNQHQQAINNLRQQRINLLVSLILLVPLLYLAMGTMLGLPNLPFLAGMENVLLFALTQLIITSVILLINRHFFTRGFKALVRRVPNMDSLIAIGAGSAYVYGIIVIFIMAYGFGHGDMTLVHDYMHSLYFEGAATIVTLVSLGKYFENRAKLKTTDAINKLMNLAPKTCIVLRDGKEQEIEVVNLVIGDEIVIRPGNVVPVDGVIISGNGLLDQSAITGESLPVEKMVGAEVISASVNQNGTFVFRANKVGKDTTIARIVSLVEKAASSKAPIAKTADIVSGVFVPIVIGIALLAFVIWLCVSQDFAFALNFAISVLVISCPCALGLATPLAIMVGTGKAAEFGILVKDAENLENLGKIDIVVLDKTGTITQGRLSVTDVIVLDRTLSKEKFLQICASVEKHSLHPLAKAIVAYYGIEQKFLRVTDYQELAGKGTAATVNGQNILIGNDKLIFGQLNHVEQTKIKAIIDDLARQGKTPVLCCKDRRVIGVIALTDQIRDDSVQAIQALQIMGLKVVMLTGDNEITAQAVSARLGIDQVVANVLPEQKYHYVEQFKQQGYRVAMVGDGINDSPALKSADIGVAIGAGTDIAMETAGIVLIKNSLADLVTAIRLSHRTINNIKLSLFWAFFYNALGIPLAAGVFYPLFHLGLNPMIASLAMSLSSVCVVLNALTLRLFRQNGKVIKIKQQKKNEVKMEKTFNIEGMSCNHCRMKVESTLQGIKGVTSATVDLENKCATVTMSKDINDKVFIKAIEKLGYSISHQN